MGSEVLLEAHQDLAKAVQPCMADLHDPAPCPVARDLAFVALFLPSGANMREIVVALGRLVTRVVIIAFVRTEMLGRFRGGCWPHHDDGVQGPGQQLHIMPMGSRHHYSNGDALAVGQQTALRPTLATVRGIGARGFPPKGALVIAPSTLCQVHSRPFRSS
jgi:hypothetical protein